MEGELIAIEAKPLHSGPIARLEERSETSFDGRIFIARAHGFVLAKSLWDEKEEIGGFRAQVALPEVQKVHVVDRGLASLDFEDDPG